MPLNPLGKPTFLISKQKYEVKANLHFELPNEINCN